jgi:hypothetical protein
VRSLGASGSRTGGALETPDPETARAQGRKGQRREFTTEARRARRPIKNLRVLRASVVSSLLPLLLLAAGCAAAPPPPRAHATAPGLDPPAAFVSPARWDYHPPLPTTALASVKLPGGGCAFTAEGGQRWTSAATKPAGSRTTCSGKAEASPFVAAEELTSAIRRGDGAWVFVGETGALFEAGDPLGPFTRTVPAPEPFARVAGEGAALLGATLDGRILRWEEASGWRAIPPSPALAGARVFDLVVGGGRALALAFPESLFASEDGGVTWAALGAPTVGARALGRTGAGDLGVQGIFETVVWRGGAAAVRGDERVHVQDAVLDVEIGRAASASSVQAGRAVVDGDGYVEVIRPENEGEAWLLSRGRIEGRLETAPVPKSEGCANLRLGARGRALILVCVSSEGNEIQAEVRRSTDAGETFPASLRLVTPDTDQINVAVSPEGAALVTGVCRSSEAGGCKPGAPLLVRPVIDGGSPPDAALAASSTNAPQLSGAALLPAFSPDGRSAYFLGRRGKDDRFSLFVSHDGGETFSPRSLDAPAGMKPPPRARTDDDDDTPAEPDGPETFDVDETSTLRPGDDGTIGLMLLRSRGGNAYITLDDDGRLLQVSSPPDDDTGMPIMGGHGRRVVALSSGMPDGGSPTLWESLDGGVSWEVQAAPQALVREYARGTPVIACGAAGCVIGDTVTRFGWGGQGDASPAGGAPDPPQPGAQSVLAPLVCDLSATAKWTRIEDVYVSSRGDDPLPQARGSMRGRSVWAVLSYDRRTGAVTATSATLPDAGDGEAHVIARSLLGPRPTSKEARSATSLSPTQMEGFAVVRARVPVNGHGALEIGAPLRDLELGWENYLEGTSGRARVPDAGPLGQGDLATPTSDELEAGLISISSHGMFVRPHAQGGLEIFADPRGRVEHFTPASWPAQSPFGGALEFRADAAAVGGELFDVGLLRGGSDWETAVLARRNKAGAWGFTADTLLPPHAGAGPLLERASWASSTRSPVGVYAVVADPQHGRAWAHFVGFRSDGTFGPAEAVPTLLDLGDRPRPCSAADRAGTPRIVMPFWIGNGDVPFPGMRHPVLVHEPRAKNAVGVDEPLVLLTAGAVVHGTPATPCVAAWEAEGVARAPVSAIIPGDLARSWLFRVAGEAPRPGKHGEAAGLALEYRPMACRFDGAARIPEAVWNERGTSRP